MKPFDEFPMVCGKQCRDLCDLSEGSRRDYLTFVHFSPVIMDRKLSSALTTHNLSIVNVFSGSVENSNTNPTTRTNSKASSNNESNRHSDPDQYPKNS